MIQSFRDRATERFYSEGACPARWRPFERIAARKLLQINTAGALQDLRSPPGNRLEALRGDRAGQWSIRINDQWRICFVWTDAGPAEVEIVDYH